MDRKDSEIRHRRGLERIAANPQAFIPGLDHPVDMALEMTLPEDGKAVTAPDITLVMKNGDLHLVEFKLNSDSKYRKRARQQLEKAKAWYRRHHDIGPEHIYTHIIFRDDPEYAPFFKGV